MCPLWGANLLGPQSSGVSTVRIVSEESGRWNTARGGQHSRRHWVSAGISELGFDGTRLYSVDRRTVTRWAESGRIEVTPDAERAVAGEGDSAGRGNILKHRLTPS